MSFKETLTKRLDEAEGPFKRGADTTAHVKAALTSSGYNDHSGIHKATFVKMTPSGAQQHKIHFHNDNTGKKDTGHVYIDQHGKADY